MYANRVHFCHAIISLDIIMQGMTTAFLDNPIRISRGVVTFLRLEGPKLQNFLSPFNCANNTTISSSFQADLLIKIICR